MTTPPFLIFVHIQKAGGISLQRILRRKLGPSLPHRAARLLSGKSQNLPLEASLRAKTPEDRYFVGHCCYGVHRLLPTPYTYITLLREPVSRVISLYYYSRSNSTAFYHHHAVNKSLEDFALHTPLMELDNGQVRFIAGDPHDCFINRTPIGRCDRSLLELAKRNIERDFSWVGLTEYYDQSLLLLAKQMNWNHCLYLRRNTKQKNSDETISISLREKIAEQNWLDVELYHYAQKRLFAALEENHLDDPAIVETFRSQNERFNAYFGAPYAAYDLTKAIIRGQLGRPL
ncbi:MAG: sulfotransferase family 2 domain-containing protein [Synechococcales cyanobacterium M58_A2018_015]|nr:sulfotransferase family 2 domain-containing protein [Synechococcales cyanobacterium M58_A2018_015]